VSAIPRRACPAASHSTVLVLPKRTRTLAGYITHPLVGNNEVRVTSRVTRTCLSLFENGTSNDRAEGNKFEPWGLPSLYGDNIVVL
jgi:hypothetical protein